MCHRNEVGVDGVILPDLPMYEFETMYKPLFEKNNLKFIFLVTPETSEERIKKLMHFAVDFYMPFHHLPPQAKTKPLKTRKITLKNCNTMQLKNPILVGFGIKDKATFGAACKYTNGAIIGSAYIKALQKRRRYCPNTKEFVKTILG
ncbi:MAG: tryptophan synthase subunit alpha [Ferruginibacter sp.]